MLVKKLIAMLMMLGAGAMLYAAEAAAPVENQNCGMPEWYLLSFEIFPGLPNSASDTMVCGVKVGAPISEGSAPVYGVEAAVGYAGTQKVTGIQTSLIMTDGEEVTGLQFAIMNFVKNISGVQLGISNVAHGKSFQIGLSNYIEGATIPWLPIINFKF